MRRWTFFTSKLSACLKKDPRGLYTVGSPTFPAERAFNILSFRKAFGTPNYYTGGGGLHCGNGAHMIGGIYHASWSVIPDFKYCNLAVYWGCSKGTALGTPRMSLRSRRPTPRQEECGSSCSIPS